ncbi:MAG: epoxyqueuosine reductase [Ruminococcaceae bacterium]|nr:epoxyqueuosine reductase [Oscillospiraceae bacterium]
MIRDILSDLKIDSFAFIPSALCREANGRLFSSVPRDMNVIFMLFPYYSGNGGGDISAYGAVHDYHGFAKEVFSSLETYISDKYPASYVRGFSDHSPYLECEGAARAGLGIIGENSLLICEKYSSYVFIGELITSLSREELSAEGVPEGDGILRYCEGCGACKAACPAGCAGKRERESCVSHLTQKKGELSDSEKDLIKKGGSIWGCDACQSVCPHTKKALREGTLLSPVDYFRSSYIGEDPVRSVEEMEDDSFALYPFAWRKRQVIERNISIIKEKNND